MKKKRFIIGLSIVAVITLYFAYHRFETSIPVEIDAPYGITCTTSKSRIDGDHYSLCLHINLPFLSACGSKAHIVMNNSCLCRHLILYFN